VIRARRGGVILHPTSLPGPFGIGDLGPGAVRWLSWLQQAGIHVWQILPIGPAGEGHSPYHSLSAFAGNPLLISPERLLECGFLDEEDLKEKPDFQRDEVDFAGVVLYKRPLLHKAARRFLDVASTPLKSAFHAFCESNQAWLEDFVLFIAILEQRGGEQWVDWPQGLADRDPEALQSAREDLSEQMQRQRVIQFLVHDQWQRLRREARAAGILIFGDLPIFVAHNSADVWAHRHLFRLDAQGQPVVVAGVPPDYFSETGQRWGNPLYDWEIMKVEGYAWWMARVDHLLGQVDVIRLDHFRGFQAAWEIPAEEETALAGRWAPGPGESFFRALQEVFDELPFVAEDLGKITDDVVALREAFQLPGMRVLQLAFDGGGVPSFLPHNFEPNTVVYTGTHDNDTAVGWYTSASEGTRRHCRRYLNSDGSDIAWDLIRAAWSSVAGWALAPMQDFLKLGRGARMNTPSRGQGNWTWRVRQGDLTRTLAGRIRDLNERYGRL
jgi:4-alpha-glucanotransferase